MTSDSNDLDSARIERYLAQDASPDDVRCLDAWAADHPGRQNELHALANAVARGAARGHDWHRDARWERLRAEIQHTRPRSGFRTRFSAFRWQRPVLGLAVAATTAFVITQFIRHPSPIPVASDVYTTRAAEHKIVTLNDGTRVTLNAASRLEVPRDFGGDLRAVALDGEALFDVTSASGAPFVVRNGMAHVTVLGTQFVVRRYTTDSVMRVAVVQGRVSVKSTTPVVNGERRIAKNRIATVLSAGAIAELSKSGNLATTLGADIARDTAWVSGRLVFRDTPFRDAIPEIERRYDLVIHVAVPALAKEQLTATLNTESVNEALDFIAATFNVTYVRHGRIVTFVPASTSAARVRRTSTLSPPEMHYGR